MRLDPAALRDIAAAHGRDAIVADLRAQARSYRTSLVDSFEDYRGRDGPASRLEMHLPTWYKAIEEEREALAALAVLDGGNPSGVAPPAASTELSVAGEILDLVGTSPKNQGPAREWLGHERLIKIERKQRELAECEKQVADDVNAYKMTVVVAGTGLPSKLHVVVRNVAASMAKVERLRMELEWLGGDPGQAVAALIEAVGREAVEAALAGALRQSAKHMEASPSARREATLRGRLHNLASDLARADPGSRRESELQSEQATVERQLESARADLDAYALDCARQLLDDACSGKQAAIRELENHAKAPGLPDDFPARLGECKGDRAALAGTIAVIVSDIYKKRGGHYG
jgi:hypothetical protein